PAALLALDAVVHTDRRTVPADAFFTGLFETALAPDELVTAVRFSLPRKSAYVKFAHRASKYAVVAVMIAPLAKAVRAPATASPRPGPGPRPSACSSSKIGSRRTTAPARSMASTSRPTSSPAITTRAPSTGPTSSACSPGAPSPPPREAPARPAPQRRRDARA